MTLQSRMQGISAARSPNELSPIQSYLQELHEKIGAEMSGEVATYIPELGRANPNDFGIAMVTVDGTVFSVGAAMKEFTIQSMSKPFGYGNALREVGRDRVLQQVGVEPTGEAFNSITLDDHKNRPYNPMVNSGAIAITELTAGSTEAEREANLLRLFSDAAGRDLSIDEEVFHSELETGHRNRAIAYMMLNSGMIAHRPEEVLRLYFKQCSIRVTCVDMAVMAATLANYGTNPQTKKTVFEADHVRDVLTLMSTCGMYNYAGEWAYEVGLPAKSGVSGGIIVVVPGEVGFAIYSPRLDQHGNSIRGIMTCKEISEDFSLHALADRMNVESVIRREYRGSAVSSKKVRAGNAQDILAREGDAIAVIEAQGTLYFGSAEKLIRRLMETVQDARYAIVDFKRVTHADLAAIELIAKTVALLGPHDCQLAITGLSQSEGSLARLRAAVERDAATTGACLWEDVDHALQEFEDDLLEPFEDKSNTAKSSLRRLDLLEGLSDAEFKALESCVTSLSYEAGAHVLQEGQEANLFFVVARGTVSIFTTLDDGRRRRLSSVGPGFSFGEMALLGGREKRSADVFADEPLLCYGFAVERINELTAEFPNIKATILGNVIKSLSDRLRIANREIRALE